MTNEEISNASSINERKHHQGIEKLKLREIKDMLKIARNESRYWKFGELLEKL